MEMIDLGEISLKIFNIDEIIYSFLTEALEPKDFPSSIARATYFKFTI